MKRVPAIYVRLILVLCAGLYLSGCTKAGIAVANLPVTLGVIDRHANISYGSHDEMRLDIYTDDDINQPKPVVVFFHGGNWQDGSKDPYKFIGAALVSEGFVVVVPDYRDYPAVQFPTFMNDAARAVSWVQNNIELYGGDDTSVFLMGHSSGAHIAGLLTADETYLHAVGGSPDMIRGMAGLAGPYDFIPEAEDLKTIFETAAPSYDAMQVSTFIDGSEPPFFLLHGMDDTLVSVANLVKLSRAVKKKGGQVETKIYEGVNHRDIVAALIWFLDDRSPIKNDITEFFRRTLPASRHAETDH